MWVRVETSVTHSRAHDLHGDGEHDAGPSLSSNGVQGLQVTQLEGSGRGNGVGSFLQCTRCIQFTLGRNNLRKKPEKTGSTNVHE